MNKNAKKVNPYEKKKKRSLKIGRKQWIAIISVLSVAALIAGIVVALNLSKSSDGHYEGDGHNHGTSANGNSHSANDGHNHGSADNTGSNSNNSTSSTDKVKYQLYTNADKTYRLVIRDSKNEIVFEKDKIAKQPLKETMNKEKGVYELGWATDKGPNDYECVYYNAKTGEVSQLFVAPRGCDGTRIAYGSEDQKKVIVQDLFDKDAYYKEYELKNTKVDKNGDIIVGGRLHENKKTVIVSYNSTETDSSAHATIKLYE